MTPKTCKADPTATLRSECPRWNPDDTLVILSCNVAVPEGAFWLWNPASGSLDRLVVPCYEEAAALVETLRNRHPDRWLPSDRAEQEALARYMLSPHTALPVRAGILVSASLFGTTTYLLDTKAGTCSALCRNEPQPVWTYSPTPGLNADRDRLFTTRWRVDDNDSHDDATGYSEIIGIDLGNGTEKVYARAPIADNIHDVAVLQDQRHILLNEFQTGLNARPPGSSATGRLEYFEALRQIGTRQSRLALVDLETGDCTTWTCPWPAPAHVVFDPDDPNVFYLVCHNMAVVEGKLYLFGPGCLVRLRIRGREFQVEAHYSHSTFYRLSTHNMVTYRGRKAIAVTVYPNRCEIIDAESFTCLASIDLYPIARLEAGRLAFPDHHAESAFSVCGVKSDDLLVLSGTQRIYVVDLRLDPPAVIESLVYNADPNWVVRAHMACLA